MTQSFLSMPNFSKTYLYVIPKNLYQEFCNAFAFFTMVKACNPSMNRQDLMDTANTEWRLCRTESETTIRDQIKQYLAASPPIIRTANFFLPPGSYSSKSSNSLNTNSNSAISSLPSANEEHILAPNTSSQHQALTLIKETGTKVNEYENLLLNTNDIDLRRQIYEKLRDNRAIIEKEKKRLSLLKSHAKSQAKLREKKRKQLNEGIAVIYDTSGRSSEFQKNPKLLDQIHDCVEFGAAEKKRRKTVIKVRTIRHLKEALQEKYNVYLTRQTLSTYLLPRHPNSRQAKRHHYPAQIKVSAVSRSEMKFHVDEHYCLASVKMVRKFAVTFANHSLIISQDDKAKVGLGVPAVGRTFKSIQSLSEPITVSDHDFPCGAKQKLIPSVYLIINPENTNETLRQGQLSIYVRPEYFVGTSSLSHMRDLIEISKCDDFAPMLKYSDHLKSIWFLLVDGGPDENPKHLKNIVEYCHLFRELDLDYLSVRTHAPYQSAYNPVERSMCTLSEKLAGIELPINKFGSHLNSQGVVVDEDLAKRNFEFSGQSLCEIWKRDNIHGRQVHANYIDYDEDPFHNKGKEPTTWLWIERHAQLCRYSLDVRKCPDRNCCSDVYAKEAIDLLKENGGFLLPLTKGKDNCFLNSIHVLQYIDKTKLSKYDEECPSLSSQAHQRLCCNICSKYFPTAKMITKHKQVIHAKKPLQKNENQTSISDLELPIVLIEHVELPYLSTEEVIESLEYLDNDNHQIQLSNSTFMEDFSNLPSIRSSCQSSEVFDLREVLSDVE
ncbi:4830_t:CDS:2 [Cetraspora pellucida]|uniref:4830_t:CDS:1 n=1 Tax=Cetraspora pellucida TaxID=1433469 RepID=A0A9N9F8G2_9GLOM|nr:4830_t:CDS:2 [Cetraspora pellucida]